MSPYERVPARVRRVLMEQSRVHGKTCELAKWAILGDGVIAITYRFPDNERREGGSVAVELEGYRLRWAVSCPQSKGDGDVSWFPGMDR